MTRSNLNPTKFRKKKKISPGLYGIRICTITTLIRHLLSPMEFDIIYPTLIMIKFTFKSGLDFGLAYFREVLLEECMITPYTRLHRDHVI